MPILLVLELSNLLRPPALAFLHSHLAHTPAAPPPHAELPARRDTRDSEALLSLQKETLLALCHHTTAVKCRDQEESPRAKLLCQ